MEQSLFAYIERLELLGFFSGYPLVYAIALFVAGPADQRNAFKSRLYRSLPYAYALVGALYLGMVLRNAYPDYSISNLVTGLEQPLLRAWAFISILFFIPFLSRWPVLSLLHSFVFFYFILADLWRYTTGGASDNQFIKNDMKMYGDSLLINIAALVLVFTFTTLSACYRQKSTAAGRR